MPASRWRAFLLVATICWFRCQTLLAMSKLTFAKCPRAFCNDYSSSIQASSSASCSPPLNPEAWMHTICLVIAIVAVIILSLRIVGLAILGKWHYPCYGHHVRNLRNAEKSNSMRIRSQSRIRVVSWMQETPLARSGFCSSRLANTVLSMPTASSKGHALQHCPKDGEKV